MEDQESGQCLARGSAILGSRGHGSGARRAGTVATAACAQELTACSDWRWQLVALATQASERRKAADDSTPLTRVLRVCPNPGWPPDITDPRAFPRSSLALLVPWGGGWTWG